MPKARSASATRPTRPGGAPATAGYPLHCVLRQELANRLLAEVCSVLNAHEQPGPASRAIGTLIQGYRRRHGWMLEELPDDYLDDEASELARYRLAPRLQAAGTDAKAVADVIWPRLLNVYGWFIATAAAPRR